MIKNNIKTIKIMKRNSQQKIKKIDIIQSLEQAANSTIEEVESNIMFKESS
mgnify:CR=1 FL=1